MHWQRTDTNKHDFSKSFDASFRKPLAINYFLESLSKEKTMKLWKMKSIVKTKTKFELIFISTETSAKIFNYGMENPQLKIVELHVKGESCSFNDLFWKSQSNENEKDFQPSFWLYFQSKGKTGSFNDVFWKSQFKWKWKGFSTVILRLFSKRKLDFSS